VHVRITGGEVVALNVDLQNSGGKDLYQALAQRLSISPDSFTIYFGVHPSQYFVTTVSKFIWFFFFFEPGQYQISFAVRQTNSDQLLYLFMHCIVYPPPSLSPSS
jgi:hypothetical protein